MMIIKTLFFCLITISFLFAQRNQILYVAAPAGLSLREEPDKDSKRLELIPYGTLLENLTMTTYGWPESFNSEMIDGYENAWIKLKYNNKTGYVFKGFTLPLAPPISTDTNLQDYLNRIWGAPVCNDSFPNTYRFDNGGEYGMNYRVLYKDGAIYLTAAMEEAWENSLINLNLDIYQAYLWFYLLQKKFFDQDIVYDKISFPTKNIDTDSSSIKILNNYSFGKELEIYRIKWGTNYAIFRHQNGRINLAWGGHI